ncbi:MAG: hypothetical protein ACI9MR_000468 [Myxococcota bacterium]|jgi:hypothetical protein
MSATRTRIVRAVVGILATTLVFSASTATAAEGDDSRLFYQNLTVIRYNPLGLQNQFMIDYRLKMYDPGDSVLLKNNYVGLTAVPILTPAGTRLGLGFKIRPLNIFKLEVKWEFLNFWGNFDLLQSFEDPNADFSDSTIKDRGEADLNYASEGWQLTIDAELRAKIGPVIVRSRFKAMYVDMALQGSDTVWYDQYYDMLLPAEGWFYTNDADILYQATPELIIGLRHTMAIVSYPDEAFAVGQSRSTDSTPSHRLGPIVAYTFYNRPEESFNKPTILLLVNWYLEHRWRTGEDVDQAIPYVVLGFAFSGDLL